MPNLSISVTFDITGAETCLLSLKKHSSYFEDDVDDDDDEDEDNGGLNNEAGFQLRRFIFLRMV